MSPKTNAAGMPLDELAKGLIHECVRNNTSLEDLHAGRFPKSKTGDDSDVWVVSPLGAVPWSEVSRISDDEMKRLMIECVNNIYTLFCHPDRVALYAPPVGISRKSIVNFSTELLTR